MTLQRSAPRTDWFCRGSTDIRFIPVAGFHGTPTGLSVRGLDDTYAGPFSSTAAGFITREFLGTTLPQPTSAFSDPATTLTTSITVNLAPTIGGTASGQTANDNATISPFGSVTINDNEGDNVTVVITLSGGDTNGLITIAGGFTKTGVGEYTLSATTTGTAQTALRGPGL